MQNNHSDSIPRDQNRFWIFNVSWRSSSAIALISLAPVTLVFIALAVIAAAESHVEISAVLFVIALVLALFVLTLSRQMFGDEAYLLFDQQGIDGKAVRGNPVAWSNIASFSLHHRQLRIELQTGRAAKRLLSLGAIPATKHQAVLRAAQDAMHLYSSASSSTSATAKQD
jgi:hypothetical protein